MFTCGQSREDASGTLGETVPRALGPLRYSMFFTYHRAGRIAVLPALATVATAVMVAGVAAIALVIIGVAGCGVWLLRVFGRLGRAERHVPSEHHETIEGVVVDSTDVFHQPPSRRSLQPLDNLDQQPHEQYYGDANGEDRQRAH